LLVGAEQPAAGILLVGAEGAAAFGDDQVRLLYAVAYQVSGSLQRLQALRASEQQRLENLVERMPAGVLLLDAEERLVLANPTGQEYLSLLAREVAPGDRLTHLGEHTLEALLLPRSGGQPQTLIVAGPPRRLFELATRRIESGPEAGGRVLVLRDVTRERELLLSERERRQELNSLYQLSRHLAASDDLQTVLQEVAWRAVETAHVTFSRLLLLEAEKLVCRAAYALRKHELPLPLPVGSPPPPEVQALFQQALHRSQPWVLPESPASSGEALLHLLSAQSLCLAPLRVGEELIGLLLLGETRSLAREPFDADKLRLTTAIADQAASALHRTRLHAELEEAYVQTVLALANAMDARDTYTSNHSQRLAAWAEATARHLGCDEGEIEAIRWAALLHDIGKIGVPDEILRKPGPLSEAEWAVMKRHPEIGAEIIAPVKKLARVSPIVRAHQEKYDGRGYPDGLKGEAIPLGARILAVVDAYGAIIDERPYKKARSHEEAVAELRRCAGTHFDPEVVEAFLEVVREE
jgi:putative nucleotidyltransferase with HDIG domain